MNNRGVGLLVRALVPALFMLFSPVSGFTAPVSRARVTVVEEKGVWWFRDAEGKRFFSLGSCCVGGCYGHWEKKPMEQGRRDWMVGLLKSWGFNTAAAWSSPSVWENLYIADQLYPPFSPEDLDVFDPRTWRKRDLVEGLRSEMDAMKGRSNLLGYFLDNERPWSPEKPFRQYRQMKPDSIGARTLVDFTRKYYHGDLKALNRAWGVKLTGFSEITGRTGRAVQEAKLPGGFLGAWRNEVAAMYFKGYAGLVRELDPGCLILGERHAGQPDAGFFVAIAPYFDVITVNEYNRYGKLGRGFGDFYKLTHKPMIITEWSFSGWPIPGYASAQFIDVYTQENRAKGYRKYVSEAAKAPFMVGMHWFLWSDYGPWKAAAEAAVKPEPIGYEADQDAHLPDHNMGLVSHDEKEVYDVLVKECTRTNAQVEGLHAASAGWKQVPETPAVKREVERVALKLDGDLAEWPRSTSVVPEVSNSLLENPVVNHTYYLGWSPEGLEVAGDISDSHLDFPNKDWAWEGDSLGVMVEFTRSGGGDQSVSFQIYPVGEGEDGLQPYAAAWWGTGNGEAIRAVKKPKQGGYTIEAVVPPAAIPGLPLYPGSKMTVYFEYHDVSGIYETHWAGDVVLK